MTTIRYSEGNCYVCGQEAMFPIIGSTNEFGSPDLDMRPPEMYRSTMDTWIQSCKACGYCSLDISRGKESYNDAIESAKYRNQLTDPTLPELASQFLCWQIIAETSGQYNQAGWAAINAAWVCDDHEMDTEAKACRERATHLFKETVKQGFSFADNPNTEVAILVDLLRRCGQFVEAHSLCEAALEYPRISGVSNIVMFQMELIENEDTNAHCFDEIE